MREAGTFETYDVLGIPVAAVSLDQASEIIVQWSQDSQGRYVGVRDVASTMAMVDDPSLLKVALNADMNVPDGMPLVWIGQRQGSPVQRTCGPDLMERMLTCTPGTGLRHFLYGGKVGVAERLAELFTRRTPGLMIVGTYSPPFRPLTPAEEAEVIALIRSSAADVVWVGMSSPKQDVWMADHVAQLSCTMIGVGAAFDFHSGAVARAPVWMHERGLEWLYRLFQEPRRLWRRYLLLAPRFVFRALMDRER